MKLGSLEPTTAVIECVCTGDAHQMGFAQGSTLQSRIVELHRRMRQFDAFTLEQPWWLPYELFLRLAENKAMNALVPALHETNPGMLSRLKGIAQGAGLPLRSLCLMNAMEALLSSVEGRTVPALAGACSALAVRGPRSRDGEPIVAHSFDYPPLVQPFFILRESRPRDGFRSLDFAVAPQAGTVDGMNQQGLCITLNYAFMTDAARPAPLITMAIADALATCGTVDEALKKIPRQPRWGAGMLMLADASGDIASLELSNTRTARRRPAPGEDSLTFTNVCMCEEMQPVQVPGNAVFTNRVPRPLRGKSVLKWHADRACRIEQLVRERDALGPDDIAAIMSDHGPDGVPNGSSPCVHTDYWRTTACLQWFPARRSLRVSYSTACEARYVEVPLQSSE